MIDKKKPDFSGIDPRQPFYLAVSVGNCDGSLGFCGEPIELATTDLAQATETCKDLVDEHGIEGFIYRCIPIRRVARGRIVVSDLKAKP